MTDTSTTADLIKTGVVANSAVDAAVDAVLADPRTGRFAIADGLYLDLVGVVRRSRPARKTLGDPDASDGLKRGTLRKTILLARPVEG